MTGLPPRAPGAAFAARVSTTGHVARVRALGALGALGLLPLRASDLDPDPDQARRWVEHELAKDDYRDRRSLLQQLIDWLRGRLSDLQNPQGGGTLSFPPFVIAGLAVLILGGLVVLATRVRRERRVASTSTTVLGDSSLTAAQLRARAAQALREGRHDDAVLDTVRAIAREADARTLLTDAPALTAHEIGEQLRAVFPHHADAVTRATDRFDAVAYGHLSATRQDADDVVATDDVLRRARPVLPDRPRPAGPGPASPGDGSPADPIAPLAPLAPVAPVAPGGLVGAGRGSWAPAGGRPAGSAQGQHTSDGDPGSVWTTGGGA